METSNNGMQESMAERARANTQYYHGQQFETEASKTLKSSSIITLVIKYIK